MAKELKKQNVSFKLTIAGSGKEEFTLKELARELDVDDCITFVGALSSEDTFSLMCGSDVFLATSNRKEGWGATINEAMAAGCAVVASNQIGAAPFLINPGVDGVIFRSESTKGLTDAVTALLGDPDRLKAVAQAGVEKIRGSWSARSAAVRLIEISMQLLTKGSVTPFEDGPLSVASVIDEDWYLE